MLTKNINPNIIMEALYSPQEKELLNIPTIKPANKTNIHP
jgi:hypothetical protein